MHRHHRHYEVLIVGSGAGGATLARELGRAGLRALVLEKGRPPARMGTVSGALNTYDVTNAMGKPRTSRQGVLLWRALAAGGSTVMSAASATPRLQAELAAAGIPLEAELAALKQELGCTPLPEDHLPPRQQQLRSAAEAQGYPLHAAPRLIDTEKCQGCGNCLLGCRYDAHWTALDYLQQAHRYGADIMYDTRIDQVMTNGAQRAYGVRGADLVGPVEYTADVVVLAAGGLGTPVILQNSGVEEAGKGLFVDLMVNVLGVLPHGDPTPGPQMALHYDATSTEGFALSSYATPSRRMRLIESGPRAFALPSNRLAGLLVQITDDPSGQVYPDGYISKEATWRDLEKLRRGQEAARDILLKAGADPDTVVTSRLSGAHPGGTAAVDRVVNSDLETAIDGLYVCDGSVLPAAPGLSPQLTVMALARRLAGHLLQ